MYLIVMSEHSFTICSQPLEEKEQSLMNCKKLIGRTKHGFKNYTYHLEIIEHGLERIRNDANILSIFS